MEQLQFLLGVLLIILVINYRALGSIPPPVCIDCIDVHCSSELDFSNSDENPYICLSEIEAQNWPKKCLPLDSDNSAEKCKAKSAYGEDYCQINGRYFGLEVYAIVFFFFQTSRY